MVLTLRNNLQSDVNLKYMECLWSLKRAINIILWVVWAPSWYVKNNLQSHATTCPHAWQKHVLLANQNSKFWQSNFRVYPPTWGRFGATYANDRSWFIHRLATEDMAFTINKLRRHEWQHDLKVCFLCQSYYQTLWLSKFHKSPTTPVYTISWPRFSLKEN